MAWKRGLEFNDPVVKRHRKKAAERIPRDAVELSEVLKRIVPGLEKPEDQRISMLRSKWIEIAGEQIDQHSEPGFIKDFVLYVYVDHPSWMPELERRKRLLLQRLQSRHRELRIRRLNFVLE